MGTPSLAWVADKPHICTVRCAIKHGARLSKLPPRQLAGFWALFFTRTPKAWGFRLRLRLHRDRSRLRLLPSSVNLRRDKTPSQVRLGLMKVSPAEAGSKFREPLTRLTLHIQNSTSNILPLLPRANCVTLTPRTYSAIL